MSTEPSTANRWRSRIRTFAIAVAFVAAFAVAWVELWRVRALANALRGVREPWTDYRLVFEVGGLEAMPDRSLTLTMDLHYDAMPDLHVERVTLDDHGVLIAEFDPWWFAVPSEQLQLADPKAATPDWIRIERRDGAALSALFNRYAYPSSIVAYASLPDLAKRPLRVRMLDTELLGGITLQHGFPLIEGALLSLVVLGVIALAKRLAKRWLQDRRAA